MTTKAEAKQQAAELLKLVGTGQGVPSEYEAALEEAYNEVYARLQVLQLAAWDTTEMPDEVTRPYVGLMAFIKKDQIGVSQATEAKIFNITGLDGSLAEWSIRAMVVEDHEEIEGSSNYL